MYNIMFKRIGNLQNFTTGADLAGFCVLKILNAGYCLYIVYQYSFVLVISIRLVSKFYNLKIFGCFEYFEINSWLMDDVMIFLY